MTSVRTLVEQEMARERGLTEAQLLALAETDLSVFFEVTDRVYRAAGSMSDLVTLSLCPTCRCLDSDMDARTCALDGARLQFVTIAEAEVPEVFLPGTTIA